MYRSSMGGHSADSREVETHPVVVPAAMRDQSPEVSAHAGADYVWAETFGERSQVAIVPAIAPAVLVAYSRPTRSPAREPRTATELTRPRPRVEWPPAPGELRLDVALARLAPPAVRVLHVPEPPHRPPHQRFHLLDQGRARARHADDEQRAFPLLGGRPLVAPLVVQRVVGDSRAGVLAHVLAL